MFGLVVNVSAALPWPRLLARAHEVTSERHRTAFVGIIARRDAPYELVTGGAVVGCIIFFSATPGGSAALCSTLRCFRINEKFTS